MNARSIFLAAVLAIASRAYSDVFISSSLGQLTTGGWDDDTNMLVAPSQRVFAADVGEDPEFPFASVEPGIHSDLTGVTVSFNLLPGLGAWDGAGFNAARGTEMAVEFGPQSAGSQDGGSLTFLIGDKFHVHPSWLFGGTGNMDPSPGIYLASFTLSGEGYATSEPFWIVFNLGQPEGDLNGATAWVQTHLVPAPGVLAAFTALLAARSRTRCSRRRAPP